MAVFSIENSMKHCLPEKRRLAKPRRGTGNRKPDYTAGLSLLDIAFVRD